MGRGCRYAAVWRYLIEKDSPKSDPPPPHATVDLFLPLRSPPLRFEKSANYIFRNILTFLKISRSTSNYWISKVSPEVGSVLLIMRLCPQILEYFVFQSWDESIPAMLRQPEVPLVFTEYYEEDCQLNLCKVRRETRKGLDEISERKTCENF